MKKVYTPSNPYLFCPVQSHQDCELTTLCTCSTCPKQGLICYLCSFVKPHIEHSKHDIIPIKLISREKNSLFSQTFASELEHELMARQETHLGEIKKVRKEINSLLDSYERKINENCFSIQEKLSQTEDDVLEKFNKKAFKDSKDFERSTGQLMKRLVKKETEDGHVNWIYSENSERHSQLLTSIRLSIIDIQSNLNTMKKGLSNIISESLSLSILDLNIDECLEHVMSKKENFATDNECSLSTWRTTENSEAYSVTLSGYSPLKAENQLEEVKKQRARPFTFGRKNEEEGYTGHTANILEESAIKEDSGEIIQEYKPEEEQVKRSLWNQDIPQRKREKPEKAQTKKVEDNLVPKKDSDEFFDDIGDYTIIKDSEIDSDLRTMIESDIRFLAGKDEIQRVIRKPEEKFDAVTFFSKVSGVSLEGFAFYCPIPCEGVSVDLEYRVYEGTQRGGKEIMRDQVNFECDIANVKENEVVERILVKTPVRLERKKWYTIVLCYLNELKFGHEERKWRDVGPFMFMGVEKKQVKEWLGMKTDESEKMYSSQFPYLIYSE